jgi:hypothetical protein
MKPLGKRHPRFSLEWREHGRWIRSVNTFLTSSAAHEHALIIGARIVRVNAIPA